MTTMQQEGVPVPDTLRGPRARPVSAPRQRQSRTPAHRRTVVQRRTPINGEMGGTQTETTTYEAPSGSESSRGRRSSARGYNPVNMADKSTGSVGGLEAEFLICLVILVLVMFANSTATFGDKIMSLMKRGALTCLLFFILAIVSNIGPNAARVAKVFGALIIVAILLTSALYQAPTTSGGQPSGVIPDIDAIIKNDWVGSAETGNTATADTGTAATSSDSVQNAVNNALETLGDSALSSSEAWLLHTSGPVASDINNAVKSLLSKIHL
jgi:hypothetical protein